MIPPVFNAEEGLMMLQVKTLQFRFDLLLSWPRFCSQNHPQKVTLMVFSSRNPSGHHDPWCNFILVSVYKIRLSKETENPISPGRLLHNSDAERGSMPFVWTPAEIVCQPPLVSVLANVEYDRSVLFEESDSQFLPQNRRLRSQLRFRFSSLPERNNFTKCVKVWRNH